MAYDTLDNHHEGEEFRICHQGSIDVHIGSDISCGKTRVVLPRAGIISSSVVRVLMGEFTT